MTNKPKPQVRVYQTMTKRWAFKSVKSGTTSNGHWATKTYAKKVARQNGMEVVE